MTREYPCVWRHEMRGGYGYEEWVPCRILERRKRVKIEALTRDGRKVVRWVSPERVQECV